MLEVKELGKGKVTHAALTLNRKGYKTFELVVDVQSRVLGNTWDAPTEAIQPYEVFLSMHLDEDNDNDEKKRNIARDQLRSLTGKELKDDWTDDGYLLLTPDHKDSLIPVIVGKEVMVRVNDAGYLNLYFPREKSRALTLSEVKKFKKPY